MRSLPTATAPCGQRQAGEREYGECAAPAHVAMTDAAKTHAVMKIVAGCSRHSFSAWIIAAAS